MARHWPLAGVRAGAGAVLLALPLWAAAQQAALGSDLASLLDYARQNNPELASMQHEAAAAAQRVQPAAALPDPVLRVELENFNNYGNSAGPSLLPSKVAQTKYTLMQQFPAWGKRELRRQAAEAEARQAQARAAVLWAEQAARIRVAYAQYFLASRNERITRELLDLVTRMEQVAQTRYAGGLVAQQDVLRAQLEQTAMRSELIAAANDKRQLQARLNALLGRGPSAPLAEPQDLPALPATAALPATELLARVREANPLVRAEAARLEAAQSNRDLTWRNRYPDFNIGITPTQMRSRVTEWTLMVEFNIPLQQASRRSQEREAAAMVEAARARAEAAATQAAAELEEQLSALEAARHTEELIRTRQLPQAELSLQSALAGYETGKVDFTSLLEALRQTRRARLDLLKTQVDAQMRAAEIERILGDAL